MTNNFFKMLMRLDSEFLQKYTSLPVSDRQTIQRLIMYTESGFWTKSEVTKLYCRNWNKSYDQIRLIFNSEGFKDRSEVTIRSQISELSRNLCEMFGSCDDIYKAFRAAAGKSVEDLTKEDGEKFIVKLDLKLKALQGYKDEPFMKRLAVNPFDFGVSSYSEQSYQISDCTNELTLLKTLSVESIQSLCSQIDMDKMAFLLQALNQPLLISERSEKHKKGSDSTYKVNRLSVNTEKLDIIQALDLVTPKKIQAVGFENSEINEESLSVNEETGDEEMFEPVSSNSGVELPFRFSLMSELCDVIQEKLHGDLKVTVDVGQRTKNITYLKKVFDLFTADGLKKYLDRFMGGDVAQALRTFEKE